MYLLIKTDSSICELYLYNKESDMISSLLIDSGRGLAKNIFNYIDKILNNEKLEYKDLTGLGVYEGPGSFTGLRIGLTVFNTLADSLSIPIVGATGEDWRDLILEKIGSGVDQKIILPFYGSPANITVSRK